jgi:hypothetical protein
MTVATTTNVTVLEGNDVATVFPFPFKVFEENHLVVTRRVRATGVVDKTYILTTEYTVTGLGTDAGTVTLVAGPLAAAHDIIITRTVPYTQDLDIVNQGGFFPETVEEQLDLTIMQVQQVAEQVERAVLSAPGTAGLVLSGLPDIMIGTDANGTLVELELEDFAGPVGPQGVTGDGNVTPEQFGATGNNIANDRPEWLTMYSYAKINAIKAAKDGAGATYAWWAPTLSLANSYDAFDVAGPCNFLTISHDFILDGNFSTINCKAYNGGSLQSVTQAITGNATWRGNGVNIIGGTAGTSSFGIKRVALSNLKVNGGWTRVTGASAAAELVFSDYLSNKGLRIQDTGIEELYCENVEFTGFGGEVWYLGSLGSANMKTTLVNCRGGNSNQSALNPSGGGTLTVIGGEYGNATIAVESLGGKGQRYIGTRFYNAWQAGFYGAANFNGSGAVSFSQPTNTGNEAEPPFINFDDVVFDNVYQIVAANYLRGDMTLLDTQMVLESLTAGENHDIYLEINCITHKRNNGTFITIQGPPTTTTAYGAGFVKLPRNIHIKVTEYRTKYAVDNGIQTAALIGFQGLVDQASVVIEVVSSETGKITGPNLPLAMPLIVAPSPVGVQLVAGNPLGETTVNTTGGGTAYALAINSPRHGLINTGAAGVVTMTMAAPFAAPGGYAFGQRCRISWNAYSTAGTIFYFAKGGANMQLNADRRLTSREEWIELEWNNYTSKWCEVDFFSNTPDRCTVAQLPAAAAAYSGARMFVTDSNAALGAGIGAIVAGGGAFQVPVVCNGVNWLIG